MDSFNQFCNQIIAERDLCINVDQKVLDKYNQKLSTIKIPRRFKCKQPITINKNINGLYTIQVPSDTWDSAQQFEQQLKNYKIPDYLTKIDSILMEFTDETGLMVIVCNI